MKKNIRNKPKTVSIVECIRIISVVLILYLYVWNKIKVIERMITIKTLGARVGLRVSRKSTT